MSGRPTESHGLFISYRREDAPGHAGRLFDRLSEHFGDSRVFMDVDSIDLGLDFVTALERALAACEVMLVLIGPRWLSTDASGRHRLEAPDDYVRMEVQRALDRGIRVIPVLVHGATLPPAERLPEPVRPLVRRQALELRDASFRYDLRLLVERLEPVLGTAPRRASPARPEPPVPAAASWEATLQRRTHGLRRLRVTLSHSSHSVEYEMRALRANVLRVDGAVVGSRGLSDIWAASDEDQGRERYEFSVLDGGHTRTGVVEVQLGNVTVSRVTLTVDGRELYSDA